MAEDSIRAEFQCRKLGLNHPNSELFTQSQWPLPSPVYCTWRGVWAAWHVVWLVAGLATSDNGRWVVGVGPLVYIATTFTVILDFALVLWAITHQENFSDTSNAQSNIEVNGTEKDEIIFQGEFIIEDDDMFTEPTPCSVKLLWLMYNIVNCCNLLVTVMHWATDHHGQTGAVEVALHALNTLFVCANLMVSAIPVQVVHFIYPAAFVATYFLFSLFYFLADGTSSSGSDIIFQAVDWNEAFPTVLTIILGIFVAVPLGHLTMFAIYTFRLFLYSKYVSDSYSFPGKNSKKAKKTGAALPKQAASVYVTGVE